MAVVKKNFKRNGNNNTGKRRASTKKPAPRSSITIPKDTNKCGYIEYNMPREMAQAMLKETKNNGNPQQYLCDVVNTQYGLMGYCTRVNLI